MDLDTSTPTGRLLLSLVASICEAERTWMLERQRHGIAKARAEGKYKGRHVFIRRAPNLAFLVASRACGRLRALRCCALGH